MLGGLHNGLVNVLPTAAMRTCAFQPDGNVIVTAPPISPGRFCQELHLGGMKLPEGKEAKEKNNQTKYHCGSGVRLTAQPGT